MIVAVLAAIGFSQLSLRTQGRIVEAFTFGDWPLEWAVRRQFAWKQPELRAIVDFVDEAPEIVFLTVTPVGLQGSLKSNELQRYDLNQPNVLQALISIQAQLINVDDERVSVFLGSEIRGATSYEVSYIYPTRSLGVADCESIAARDRGRIGACAFQLSSKWHAMYRWHPNDPEELEKAIDDLD